MKPWPAIVVLAFGLLTGACLFMGDGEWFWFSSSYQPCWSSWDCTSDTDGCFEIVVDYGWYGVSDRMCSYYCDSDWDCPFGGACYAFPVRQALTLADQAPDPLACSVASIDAQVCEAASTTVDDGVVGAAATSIEASRVDATALAVRPAYEIPICYARCSSDWDCPFGFDCIEVADFGFIDAICLPH